jgi:hypothetical protein
MFRDAGRKQLMARGLLGAAPGSAPPHAAAPGNSRPGLPLRPFGGLRSLAASLACGPAGAGSDGSAGRCGERDLFGVSGRGGRNGLGLPRGSAGVVGEHGLPLSLDTDRGAHYIPAPVAGGVASGGLCAHAVGGLRDWRVFQTLQDRLVKELARKASPSIGPSR